MTLSSRIAHDFREKFTRLESIFDDPGPELLFHYTSLDAAVKIIESRSLWFTDSSFLNDASEISWFLNRCLQVVNALRLFPGSEIEFKSYESVERLLLDLRDQFDRRIYVASFSEAGDRLSQWRAYSGASPGVAIGFSQLELKRSLAVASPKFARCVYSQDRQNELAQGLVLHLVREFSKTFHGGVGVDRRAMSSLVFDYAVFMKNHGFEEEGEWRFVFRDPERTLPPKVRVAGSRLIPYIPVEFSRESHPVLIRKLILGPGAKVNDIVDPLIAITQQHLGGGLSVAQSSIPYRL